MDNDFDHWSLVLSLGNMDSNEVVMDNAIIYSVYDSGPWIGYRFDSNPSVGWISGGKEHFDLMVIFLIFRIQSNPSWTFFLTGTPNYSKAGFSQRGL